MPYTVRYYQGDYKTRQIQANADRAVAYVEHHFNAGANPEAGYAVVVTASNASARSKDWGRWYAAEIAREFGISVGGRQGLLVGGYRGRGDGNLRYTAMPAILLEPLFASNPRHVEWIVSGDGQRRLAEVLCRSIRQFFPAGGLVAFSVGHKYRKSRTQDRGAPLYGNAGVEADFAEQVLLRAENLLVES